MRDREAMIQAVAEAFAGVIHNRAGPDRWAGERAVEAIESVPVVISDEMVERVTSALADRDGYDMLGPASVAYREDARRLLEAAFDGGEG